MPRRSDLLLGAGGAALAVAVEIAEKASAPVLVAAFVMGAAFATARSHPRVTWLFAAAVLVSVTPFVTVEFFALAFLVPGHAFCAARWDGGWGGVVALATLIAACEVGIAMTGGSPVPSIIIPAAAWGAGRALREREEVAHRLAQRVRELEEEREAHAALSVRYERAQIASELHDIVAHAISVMVVQASAGQRLAAHDPELTEEAFEAIAGAARQAEDDMGRLVALLGDERPAGTAPDVALIEELVRRAAGSGLGVRLRLEGDREGLPAAAAQAAYRVVQEGLTNALRYASGAAVEVLVRGEPESIAVAVVNEEPPSAGPQGDALADAGTGNGLKGLRERLSAVGGTLDAGPTAGGGWQVSARIPRLIPVA